MRAVLTVLAALALLGPAIHAGEAAPRKPQRPTRQLSLQEAIALALEHNLVLAAEKLNPKVAQTVVVEQQAIFDPSTYSEFTRAKSKQQSTTGLFGQRQHTCQGTVGIAKLLAPGTLVDLHIGGNREWNDYPFTEINPAYTEEWGVSISQPLLRGFGVRVNTAGIATAVNQRRITQAQLRQVGLDTVAEVTQTYWGLTFATRNRELLQRSLERALGLQREVRIRVDAGALAARPSVAQAEAEVAVRQEEIVEAEQAIRDAEDALKVITDLAADDAVWGVALLPTTAPPEAVPALDPKAAVATALARRPDYRQAQLVIDNQEIVLYVRRNELKPRLDLVTGYGNSGLNGSWADADHDFRTFDYYQWSIGITFEYPLGNRAARARFRKAKLQRNQARISLQALERQIQLELRNAIRAVRTNVERIRAVQASVKAEEARLSAETEKFKQGQDVTTQDLLDAQAALAEAERRALAALIDLNNALVDVERLQGTLLEAHNVTWEND